MSINSAAMGSPQRWFDEARSWCGRHRLLLPAIGIVVAAVIAYSYTLTSLMQYFELDTPLAYLPLLPLFAIGIAWVTVKRYEHLPQPSRDRQIDLIVGIPILAVAIGLITVVPALASTYYWADRADVLSLAFFVTAAVIIFYGTTWFWRLRSALMFLVLMWPALYLHFLSGIMGWFTDRTNGALVQIAHHVGVLGVTPSGGEGNLMVTQPHGVPLVINVGTACSGADSVLGFFLIGSAILVTMKKGLARKLAWLAVGLVLCFTLNVLRLVSILALAHAGQPNLALGGYHAVIGLVLFTVATAIMMRLLSVFGLRLKDPVPAEGVAAPRSAVRTVTRRRRIINAGLLTAVVALAAAADLQLAPYAAFADGTGVARVDAFPSAGLPKTLHAQLQADYTWAKQYFGDNSTFQRYLILNNANGVVYADVVRTDNRGTLDAYNLQNCFLFHNYSISTTDRIDLGDGVTGLLLNYTDPASHARWSTVSWAWPVAFKGQTYYERIALTSSLYGGSSQAPDLQPSDGFRGFFLDVINTITGGNKADPKVDAVYQKADKNLKSVAEQLVAGTIKHSG